MYKLSYWNAMSLAIHGQDVNFQDTANFTLPFDLHPPALRSNEIGSILVSYLKDL